MRGKFSKGDDMMNNDILSDEQIIKMYFDRDEQAISETDVKYGKYLFSIAQNILKNANDSEECRNDTYLNAWNSIPPTRPSRLGAYLARIIRNISINRWNKDHRDRRIPPEMVDSLSDFEGFLPASTDAESSAIAEVISRYLRSTTERRRYVFMSRYFLVRRTSTIAAALRVSESTVKKELLAIKRELKKKLESEGITV